MTTFQDLPPQSRRAVRQSERDGDTNAQVASGSLPTAQPFLPAPAASATSADAPQAAPQQPNAQQPIAPPVSGRRSRAAAPSGLVDMPTTPPVGVPAPEPLTYTTQATPAYQQAAGQAGSGRPAEGQPADHAAAEHTPEQQAFRVRDFSPEGRRPTQSAPEHPAAAPLDYRTQAGPPPQAQPQQAEPQQAEPQQAEPQQPPTQQAQPQPQPVQPSWPQPQGAPVSTTPPVAAGWNPPTTPPVAFDASAESAAGPTQTTPPSAASADPTQTTPPFGVPTSRRAAPSPQQTTPDLPAQTLSRRELRALHAEQDAAAALSSAPFTVPPLVEPVAAPPSNLSNAMAEFEALTRASQTAQRASAAEQEADAAQHTTSESTAAQAEQAREEQVRAEQARDEQARADDARIEAENRARFEQDEQARAEADARAQQATQAEAAQLAQAHAARARVEAAEAAEQQAQQQRARDAAAAAQATAQAEANARAREEAQQQAEILARRDWDAQQAATQQAAAQQAPAQSSNPFDALLGAPSAPSATNPAASDPLTALFVEPSIEQTGSHATSTGHWSQQAQIEDDSQPFENTLSRDVGGGNVATTTSALVLPVMPTADFGGIISGTGEILVTGSIELPRSLGATGGDSRRYDDPDVDNLFDAFDNEIISTDSAPVRAIRAVSTHTSTHGVITTANKPHGNRLLVAALIAIPVLILAIGGLLIAAFSSGMF